MSWTNVDVSSSKPSATTEGWLVLLTESVALICQPELKSKPAMLAESLGKKFRPIRLPSSLLWLTMNLSIPASWLGLSPLMTPSRYRELTSEGFVCKSERLKLLTGFEARVGLEEGLRKTIDWYTSLYVDGPAR